MQKTMSLKSQRFGDSRSGSTIAEDVIAAAHVMIAELDGQAVGMVQRNVRGGAAALDKLFVEPDRLGGGVGRALVSRARHHARQSDAVVLVDADPGAADFCRRPGAVDAGVTPSGSNPGRSTSAGDRAHPSAAKPRGAPGHALTAVASWPLRSGRREQRERAP